MMNQLVGVIVLLAVSPADMAEIVADRLARLDKLEVEAEVQIYTCPLAHSPLDRSAWEGPAEPGDGGRRVLRIVRPGISDESFLTGETVPVRSYFEPGRAVRRLAEGGATGRAVYQVDEGITSSIYTSVSLLTLLDVQIHQGLVAGLNTLVLLRDYPVTLVGWDESVSTYSVVLQSELPEPWLERYEFDLDARGTLRRLQMNVDGPNGFTFERLTYVLATAELNGAELITEAVTATRNSLVSNWGIEHFQVCAASVNSELTPQDVRCDPERRNAVITTRRADHSRVYEEYDEAGNLVAASPSGTDRVAWRTALVPIAAACGFLASIGLTLVSRSGWRCSRSRQ